MCSVMSDSFSTPWTVAHQAYLSMGFPRQEYSSGLPFPPPGDLPHPGIEPIFGISCIAGGFFIPLSHLGSPKCPVLVLVLLCLTYLSHVSFFTIYIMGIVLSSSHLTYRDNLGQESDIGSCALPLYSLVLLLLGQDSPCPLPHWCSSSMYW